jgi:hypothetical protein
MQPAFHIRQKRFKVTTTPQGAKRQTLTVSISMHARKRLDPPLRIQPLMNEEDLDDPRKRYRSTSRKPPIEHKRLILVFQRFTRSINDIRRHNQQKTDKQPFEPHIPHSDMGSDPKYNQQHKKKPAQNHPSKRLNSGVNT